MVSYEILSTCLSSTIFDASRRSVQRFRPSGTSPHVNAIKCASFSPSSLLDFTRLGFVLFNAASKPCSTNLSRIRSTVLLEIPKVSLIGLSRHFSPCSLTSAFSKTWACKRFWAAAFPLWTRFFNSSFSFSSCYTYYFKLVYSSYILTPYFIFIY